MFTGKWGAAMLMFGVSSIGTVIQENGSSSVSDRHRELRARFRIRSHDCRCPGCCFKVRSLFRILHVLLG